MIRCRHGVLLVLIMLITSACSDTPESVPNPAASATIVDAPPYICKFVPEQALRLVSGFTQPFSEASDGTADDGDCDAPNASPALLDVAWSREHGNWTDKDLQSLVDDRIETLERHEGVSIPDSMGRGMAAYMPDDDQSHQIIAKFSCGGSTRLLMMGFREFVKGRDAIKDMIDLMRIGQRRYAELYKCGLGG